MICRSSQGCVRLDIMEVEDVTFGFVFTCGTRETSACALRYCGKNCMLLGVREL